MAAVDKTNEAAGYGLWLQLCGMFVLCLALAVPGPALLTQFICSELGLEVFFPAQTTGSQVVGLILAAMLSLTILMRAERLQLAWQSLLARLVLGMFSMLAVLVGFILMVAGHRGYENVQDIQIDQTRYVAAIIEGDEQKRIDLCACDANAVFCRCRAVGHCADEDASSLRLATLPDGRLSLQIAGQTVIELSEGQTWPFHTAKFRTSPGQG